MTLVLTGAGVHQDSIARGSEHEGLIGDDHHSERRIEHLRLHVAQVAFEYGLVIGGEKVLRAPPRAFALDHRVDRDVADPDLMQRYLPSSVRGSVRRNSRAFKLT